MRASVMWFVVCLGLLGTSCHGQPKAPLGIDMPRIEVSRHGFMSPYPVRVHDRFVLDRTLHEPLSGAGTDVAYGVGWTLEILGSPSRVTTTDCELSPVGDVFVHGTRLERPAIACTPQGDGPWLALERGCRGGRVGFGASELALETTTADFGTSEGHYLLRRDHDVVAAVEIAITPGTQGIWERDGLSIDEQAAIAFTATALEWITPGYTGARVCR